MRRLAAESIVLLKNDGDILPLKPKVSIGPCQPHLPCADIPRQEQGLKKIAIVGDWCTGERLPTVLGLAHPRVLFQTLLKSCAMPGLTG